jgi:hypothetical protein
MTPAEQRRHDALYEIVYMGQPEAATPDENAVGLRGGSELQALITAWRRAEAGEGNMGGSRR